jgi:hypothetical protein
MRTLIKFFSLRIYGNQLLSSSSKAWFNIVKLNLAILTILVAISWGYAGSILGLKDNFLRFMLGFGSSLVVFVVFWTINASFINLDRYRRHYESKIFHAEEVDENNLNPMVQLFRKVGTQVSVVLKILMITIVIICSAPFLNQLIFSHEIDVAIIEASNEIISNKSKYLRQKYAYELKKTRDSLNKLENQIIIINSKEKGASRKSNLNYLLGQIKHQEDLILNLEIKQKREIEEYYKLIEKLDYPQLEEKFGVILPNNSFFERSKVLSKFFKDSKIEKIKTASTLLLIFLYFSLIILKLFEPRGVRIYLSESLQQLYNSYKNGALDKFIVEQEKYEVSPMTPFRFEEWCLTIYPSINVTELSSDNFKSLKGEGEEEGVKIKQLILNNKFEEAIGRMLIISNETGNKQIENNLILSLFRLRDLRNKLHNGLIDLSYADSNRNRILNDLLLIADELTNEKSKRGHVIEYQLFDENGQKDSIIVVENLIKPDSENIVTKKPK